MDITFKQLQIFQAVVVTGSITKASRRIGLSQPSISQQLARLETKLDTQLMLRNRSGVIELTPSGEYWSKASADLLHSFERTVNDHRQSFLGNTVNWQMGVPPTLLGRFVAAAARIASRHRGLVKFAIRHVNTSDDLMQQLRLHQLNCAVVSQDAIEGERGSLAIAKLFDDPMAWVVPASVSPGAIKLAMNKERPRALEGALAFFVDVGLQMSSPAPSNEWFRHNLPHAIPAFSAVNHAQAVDLVAAGLATAHCPLSLLPNLSSDIRAQIRILPIPALTRQMVLVMPKHLMTLRGYAEIFRGIEEFCRTEYVREMVPWEDKALAALA